MMNAKGEDHMDTLLKNLKLSARVEEGPLGPYIPAYAAQLLSRDIQGTPLA
jgi:hypothetical protein